nr:unnamed protein product [Digitaria exilis]
MMWSRPWINIKKKERKSRDGPPTRSSGEHRNRISTSGSGDTPFDRQPPALRLPFPPSTREKAIDRTAALPSSICSTAAFPSSDPPAPPPQSRPTAPRQQVSRAALRDAVASLRPQVSLKPHAPGSFLLPVTSRRPTSRPRRPSAPAAAALH